MEAHFAAAGYKGSKRFSQQEVAVANATGFGAAADDYAERGIDLNEQLILNKPATFFFRMQGTAMLRAGIRPDDILIVDRSIAFSEGRIVVVAVENELLVRQLHYQPHGVVLRAADDHHAPVELMEKDYQAWGVVTCIIHLLEPRLKPLYASSVQGPV